MRNQAQRLRGRTLVTEKLDEGCTHFAGRARKIPEKNIGFVLRAIAVTRIILSPRQRCRPKFQLFCRSNTEANRVHA